MLRIRCLVGITAVLFFVTSPVQAQNSSMQDIQDLPSAKAPVVDSSKAFEQNHWAYKTLENTSRKYGLLVGKPGEKFDGKKPLTRNEAAVILVNLVGKIEQDNVTLSETEKAQIDILRNELSQETTKLAGRIDKVETSVDTLKGSVSKLQSGDNKNIKMDFGEKFKINGGFQFKFIGNMRREGADVNSSNPSNFSIPLSDFYFSGQLAPHLKYAMEIFPMRSGNSGSYQSSGTYSTKGLLGDAFVSTDILPHHNLFFGQTRVPIGQEGALSPYNTDFVNKAQIGRNYGDFRAPGIKVVGNYPFVDYYAGAFTGDRDNGISTTSRQLDYAVWAVFKPLYKHPKLGKLEVGGGYDIGNSNYASTTNNYSHNNFDFYGGYTYKKYAIKGEFAKQTGYNAPGVKSNGWYLNNSYFLTKNLQLEGRFDFFDPNETISRNQIREYSIGTNYYMMDQHLKLMLDYVYVHNEAATNSHRIMAMSQYKF